MNLETLGNEACALPLSYYLCTVHGKVGEIGKGVFFLRYLRCCFFSTEQKKPVLHPHFIVRFCSFSSKLFYFVAKNWLQCRIKSQLSVGEKSLSGSIVIENKEKSIKWTAFNLFMTQLLREKRWKGLLDLRKSIFSSFEPVLPQLGIHF